MGTRIPESISIANPLHGTVRGVDTLAGRLIMMVPGRSFGERVLPAAIATHPSLGTPSKKNFRERRGDVMNTSAVHERPRSWGWRLHGAGLLFLVVALATLIAPLAHADGESEKMLDRVRGAIGHSAMRAWERGIRVEARGEALGLKSRFAYTLMADGLVRNDTVSELGSTEGFDGECGWRVDFTGMPSPVESAELEILMLSAWVMGGHWLDRSCPLEITSVNGSGADDRFRALLALPGGILRAVVEIDAETLLPAKMTWKVITHKGSVALDSEANHTLFQDYKWVKGRSSSFLFPHTIVTAHEGMVTTVAVDRVLEAPADGADACTFLTVRPEDTHFDAQKPAAVEMTGLPSGHLLIKPLVDGRDLGWFLFDTGAGMNVIDTAAAEALGLGKIGEIAAAGVGGIAMLPFRKAHTLELGPVKIDYPLFLDVDLGFVARAFGKKIGGVIGHGLLTRCLVELDIEEGELLLYEPGAWDEREADWQRITFMSNDMVMTGKIPGGREGRFILDTGAGGTVSFHSSFVSREELFGESGGRPAGFSGGVGGMVAQYGGTIDWFEFGGLRHEDLSVVLLDNEGTSFMDQCCHGLIGNELLSRSPMLISYPGRRIAFLERD